MYYNKGIIIRDIGNVQFLDQEESKLNSTLTKAVVLIHLQMTKKIKSAFKRNNVATIKCK